MKVVVTGAGALLGQGILRCLLESPSGHEVVAVDPNPESAGLYWTPHRHLVPMASDGRYLTELGRVLERERPAALLVGTDVELPLLAAHRTELERAYGVNVVVSSSEVVAIADDKLRTATFMEGAGFPAPRSCAGEDAEAVEALVQALGFPLVVKPRVGARSIGFGVVHDRTQLARALAGRSGLVVQEHVGNDREEYTAGAIVFDGRCDAAIVMRRELRDGNTFRAWVDRDEALTAQVRRMAEALGSYGPVNFQFRRDGDQVKVFEINARFSGTTPLRMRAGFDEVDLVLRRVVLGEAVVQPEVREVAIARHWSETVLPSALAERLA